MDGRTLAPIIKAEIDDLRERLREKDKENQFLANQLILAKSRIRQLETERDDAKGNHAQIIEAFEAVINNAEPGQCKAMIGRIVMAHRKALNEQ